MQYAICTVPAAPVRKEAAHRSEMVNQLLFGEAMQVLEEQGEWLRIRSVYDDYEGWLTHHLVAETDSATAHEEARFVATGLVNPVVMDGILTNVPMGSFLPGFNPETASLWDGTSRYEGAFRSLAERPEEGSLIGTALPWLNAPYLWGGKTFMGVDCSGFVQTVFKILGMRLKRDAWQQAEQGKEVALGDAALGDLAFFHNEKGRIVHVGMLLNGKEIIHAAGKVRIDSIDEKGIYNRQKAVYTHSFTALRRFL